MQFRIPLHVPVVPMLGDPIDVDGESVAIMGEFARLPTTGPRFAVQGADGNVYEVEIAVAGNGRRGSQRWKAARRIPRAEFRTLGRDPVR